MTAPAPTTPNSNDTVRQHAAPGFFAQWLRDWSTLRKAGPIWESLLLAATCIGLCLCGWWFVTRGEAELRLIGPLALPSPAETFDKLPELFSRFHIIANTAVTLRRVASGFLLAVINIVVSIKILFAQGAKSISTDPLRYCKRW